MATMTAYRMIEWKQHGYVEVPVPAPGPGEVRVRVAGVGLCHSDILFLDAEPGRFPNSPPYTLGHEIAGWVDEVGPGVTGLSAGDAVVASSHLGCGLCSFCRRGYDNYCTAYPPRPPTPITSAVDPATSFGNTRFTAWYDV